MMVAHRQDTKSRLISATIRLAAKHGNASTTIQAIAREVGITEGAIYRHYRSKDELRWQAYQQTIEGMAQQKQQLVFAKIPFPEKLRQWIEYTYTYFDQYPEAFTYVLLMPHPEPRTPEETEITTRQGHLFMEMFEIAKSQGDARPIPAEIALSHFTGLMLNIPRLINEGVLSGPALRHVDEVTQAIACVLHCKPQHDNQNAFQ
jgi:AcrR family transcriptional regulator